jgi:DNA primase
MSFSPDFLDELRQRLPLSEVVGRKVRLVRKGREHSGLCPFHNEKSPSFTVNDDKAFYHCFGCGAHGDLIGFVMETEGLSFAEAVERLAAQAGLAVPRSRPEDARESQHKATLYDALEAAAHWFESQLAARAGQEATAYLTGRGLTPETIQKFRLGVAPDHQTALKDALIARKIAPELLEESGLVIKPEDGRPTFDRFRHRVMFPITDQRGKVVAFGGRTLGDASAKYLNSPETPLFHKGRLLYNYANARKAAHDKGRVIVVEGYMDVIALAQAGFDESVAPLGTALTEDQIALLWRLAPEPTLCFDGDTAGLRAAHRAAERALPLLKPGHSLRFAFLPEGEDPDSFVKSEGPQAMNEILSKARPLADVLWEMLFEGAMIDTPERRAGFEAKVEVTLSEIADAKIKNYYRAEFRDRLNRALAPARTGFQGNAGPSASYAARPGRAAGRRGGFSPGRGNFSSGAKGFADNQPRTAQFTMTELARATKPTFTLRERLLVLIVLNHPGLLEAHMEDFAQVELGNAELDKLRNEIIRIAAASPALETEALKRHLKERGLAASLDRLENRGALANVWYAWPLAALDDAERGWLHSLAFHRRILALEEEKKAAEKALAEEMTDESFDRFRALTIQLEAAEGQESSLEGFGLASGREISA